MSKLAVSCEKAYYVNSVSSLFREQLFCGMCPSLNGRTTVKTINSDILRAICGLEESISFSYPCVIEDNQYLISVVLR